MVTLPSEAATDPDYVLNLARHGMDVARINCAHDDADAWRAMAGHVRKAGEQLGRQITVLMDIAGPKIRTEVVLPVKKGKPSGRLLPGDALRLVAHGEPHLDETAGFSAAVSLPEIVTRLSVGHRVRYDDGKVEGVVESVNATEGEALIRILHTRPDGTKLKPEKGINLPDTALGLSPLTAKDDADLATVLECADLLGYSFVSRPKDLDLLDEAIARHGREHPDARPLGLMAKIERPEAVKNLPDLIARAARRGPFSVMIARGDLAAEIGFERLAEMQEELLWICEAAAVPAIWATQVLEDLVRDGIPSRGEMTDAAMAARAECVMLNKGPAVVEAIDLLDRLLGRMAGHLDKKTPVLRALRSW
jgi:pyruvate kinase